MKTILAFCVALCFISCDSSTNSIDPNIPAMMTCSIDGNSWTAKTIKGIDSGGTLTTNASDNNGKSISLALESAKIKVGAVLDATNVNNSLLDDTRLTTQSATWAATSGSITITAASKSAVSGKFSFVATDLLGKNKDVKITDGVFTTQIFY